VIASGTVNSRLEAILRIVARGPDGATEEFDAVIDTGYSGSLLLPASLVRALGLVKRSSGRAQLADGSVRSMDSYLTEVWWGGTWQSVVASVLDQESLVGMSFLEGRELAIHVTPGGSVRVT